MPDPPAGRPHPRQSLLRQGAPRLVQSVLPGGKKSRSGAGIRTGTPRPTTGSPARATRTARSAELGDGARGAAARAGRAMGRMFGEAERGLPTDPAPAAALRAGTKND